MADRVITIEEPVSVVIVEDVIAELTEDEILDSAVVVDSREVTEYVEVAAQGAAGSIPRYVHAQTTESAEWIVNHNLGEKPIVEITNSGGEVVGASVLHISFNQARVYFSFSTTGQARCL